MAARSVACRRMGSETDVTWDLSELIDLEAAGLAGEGADRPKAAVAALLEEAEERAEAFAERYEGEVGSLDGPGLLEAMQALAALSELVARALNYAHLSFAADTADPEIGALLQSCSERATQINTRLLFFELEWVAIEDERAEELLATEGLDFCRHHLRLERRYRPHLLSAPEERIISELSITGAGAWSRLFDEVTSAIRVELPGAEQPTTLDEALSKLFDPDRDVRRSTAEAVTGALEPGLRTRAYIFNTLLQEKSTKDRLRSYPHWLATRNLSNEASDESVQALIDAVKARYELPRRWYRTKAKLLGPRAARRLRPDGSRRRRRRRGRLGRGPRDRARYVRLGLRRDARCRRPLPERGLDRRSAAGVEARRRLQRLDRAQRAPLRDAQLDQPPARRDDARPRARPRHPPVPRPRSGDLPPVDAADRRRDGLGVRRGAGLRPAALADHRRRRPPGAAGRGDRGPDRDRLPPGRDEPVRGRGPQRAPRARRALGRALRRALGRAASTSCSATRSSSPTATAPGGATSPTSSARPATSTPTPTASCWRSASTASTSSGATRSSPATWRCSAPAAPARPRISASWSVSTSAIRASGTAASTSSRSSSRPPSRPPRRSSENAKAFSSAADIEGTVSRPPF